MLSRPKCHRRFKHTVFGYLNVLLKWYEERTCRRSRASRPEHGGGNRAAGFVAMNLGACKWRTSYGFQPLASKAQALYTYGGRPQYA
ncbi:hypothetical protein GCK72_004881 [Caenorhabditis remanei]|uniref:Uncharacterized protein n=1 Tax=Caenorhabditis remanei TaxID=31234 RepID=A0A6A5HAS7_CAERE|nr:hypothetical protein GCK72_004881 [Caenorhabditis remanei]KAF1764930.1 hypothetical protein GCK72_004881 [Caenorhabditis remanei]